MVETSHQEWLKTQPSATEAGKSDDPVFTGPNDIPHATSHQVVKDILAGKIIKPARDQLRDALDKADAAPAGRAKTDQALGRAIR